MLPRFAIHNVKEALADTPVVFIMGPRQSGKTTLIRTLIDETWEYVTLDDQAQLEKDKVEVDVIIENASGDCFAVEVKAAATLNARDFSGLKRFRDVAGRRFRLGVLLYDGDRTTAFGEHLFAVPIGALLHCTHTPDRAERRRRRSTPFRGAGSRPIRRRSPCAAR